MCIHGDKSQPERDWVLNGESVTDRRITWAAVPNLPRHVSFWSVFFFFFLNGVFCFVFLSLYQIDTCKRTSLAFVLLISVLVPFFVLIKQSGKIAWCSWILKNWWGIISWLVGVSGIDPPYLASGKWAFNVIQIQVTIILENLTS